MVQMSLTSRFILTLLITTGLSAAPPRLATAFVRNTVDDKPNILLYWPTRVIPYWVHHDGAPGLSLEQVTGAVRRSFLTWSSPSCTDLQTLLEGITDRDATNLTSGESEADLRNVVRWQSTAWPPAGSEDTLVTSDMLALTVLVFNAETGVILDADIDVNGVDYAWSVAEGSEGSESAMDIENVLTHEVGHLFGLGHTPEAEATMFLLQEPGETSKRSLEDDDIAGICAIYPFGAPTPLGEGQPRPALALTGGCRLTATPAAPGPLWLALAVVALLRSGRRAPRYVGLGAPPSERARHTT
jgi:hypothetical protein